MVRLGVNVDHVATLRQARGEKYPSVVEAARVCLLEGADQITIHLREDRRHIQDHDIADVRKLTREYNKLFNLEMGCSEEITGLAIKERPDWVCLVPEKREEKTTEGGLNLVDPHQWKKVQTTCLALKKALPQVKISLFLEAEESTLVKTQGLSIDAVEIHTGEYAKVFLELAEEEKIQRLTPYLKKFAAAQDFLTHSSLGCHAGHGLTYASVIPLLKTHYFTEYNIGHWIVSEAIFKGLPEVIRLLKGQFDAHSKFPGDERD